MEYYSILPAITDQAAAPYIGKKCRCGCGQTATYLTLSADLGETEASFEACCEQARDYISECCAELRTPFRSRRIPAGVSIA